MWLVQGNMTSYKKEGNSDTHSARMNLGNTRLSERQAWRTTCCVIPSVTYAEQADPCRQGATGGCPGLGGGDGE